MRWLMVLFLPVLAFAADTGWKSPTVATDGAGWSNEDSVLTSDDRRAVESGASQNILICTTYAMSVPEGATIDSIWVKTEGYSDDPQAPDRDLVHELTTTGGNTAGDGDVELAMPKNVGNEAYDSAMGGTSGPLWGYTWTADSVNLTSFGVRIWKQQSDGDAINVDHTQIKVFYTVPSGAGTMNVHDATGAVVVHNATEGGKRQGP